jgi:hypothetical protein
MASRDLPNPVWVDRSLIDQALNITETLVNLNFLMCAEADDPARTRSYGNHSEERLQALVRLLQSIPVA